jgi:hypothetical protein
MTNVSIAKGCLVACATLALGAFAGSALSQGALPASTAKLYPDSHSASPVKGSQARAVAKGKIQVDYDSLLGATHKVASQKGLKIDYEDKDNGILSGMGYWHANCGGEPCKLPVTFAAYFEPADCDGKEWDLTLVLDRHGPKAGDGEQGIAQTFLGDVQKAVWTKR